MVRNYEAPPLLEGPGPVLEKMLPCLVSSASPWHFLMNSSSLPIISAAKLEVSVGRETIFGSTQFLQVQCMKAASRTEQPKGFGQWVLGCIWLEPPSKSYRQLVCLLPATSMCQSILRPYPKTCFNHFSLSFQLGPPRLI